MTDDLTLTDIQGETRLEVESLDEEGGQADTVRLTIKPGQRGVPSQAISLYEAAEENLATFLLKDLVDEDSASVALTPEDHRVLSDLGISQREDGRWGYKLGCANRRCANNAPTCYCADGILEAVQDAASRRSKHVCGFVCGFVEGFGDYLADIHLGDTPLEDWLEATLDRTPAELHREVYPHADEDAGEDQDYHEVLRNLANRASHGWGETPEELFDEIEDRLREGLSELDIDPGYDPDMNECACPTGGGPA